MIKSQLFSLLLKEYIKLRYTKLVNDYFIKSRKQCVYLVVAILQIANFVNTSVANSGNFIVLILTEAFNTHKSLSNFKILIPT